MKKLIMLLILAAHANAGWFDHGEQAERDRRIAAEQQLQQERHTEGGWEIIAGAVSVAAVVLFILGTALGSKTRSDANKS